MGNSFLLDRCRLHVTTMPATMAEGEASFIKQSRMQLMQPLKPVQQEFKKVIVLLLLVTD